MCAADSMKQNERFLMRIIGNQRPNEQTGYGGDHNDDFDDDTKKGSRVFTEKHNEDKGDKMEVDNAKSNTNEPGSNGISKSPDKDKLVKDEEATKLGIGNSSKEGETTKPPSENPVRDKVIPKPATRNKQPLTGDDTRESSIIGYLRYFQSMLCARNLPCDDNEPVNNRTNTRGAPFVLYQSWRKKPSNKCPELQRKTTAVAAQQTDNIESTPEQKTTKTSKEPKKRTQELQDRGDTLTTTVESTANLNAWSQIYNDITQNQPQKHTRSFEPNNRDLIVTPVTTAQKFPDNRKPDKQSKQNDPRSNPKNECDVQVEMVEPNPETKTSIPSSLTRLKQKMSRKAILEHLCPKIICVEIPKISNQSKEHSKLFMSYGHCYHIHRSTDIKTCYKQQEHQQQLQQQQQQQHRQPKILELPTSIFPNEQKKSLATNFPSERCTQNDTSPNKYLYHLGNHISTNFNFASDRNKKKTPVKKHLNNLGCNIVNTARNQAHGFFGVKKMKDEDKSVDKKSIYDERKSSATITNVVDWYKHCRKTREKYFLEEKFQKDKEIKRTPKASIEKFQRFSRSQRTNSSRKKNKKNLVRKTKSPKTPKRSEDDNLEQLKRKIKKKHVELETLRKSIQKEAKGVCCELKKFQEDEKQQIKEQKLKDKQQLGNNGDKYVKDQEHDKKAKSRIDRDYYENLLMKYSLVDEECKIFHDIHQQLQHETPKISELRNKSNGTSVGQSCVKKKK
ncbi:hypothetical protein WDU94_008846 [Cyamophila willieti]